MNLRPFAASGWNAIARNRIARPALAEDLTVKHLVIGAGYAGLAAARRLAKLFPNDQIALVDAQAIGENSSGRNSGFMIDLPYAKIDNRGTRQEALWQTELLGAGLKMLQGVVDEHGIQCGWHKEIGHYKAATTAYGAAELKSIKKTLETNRVLFRELTPTQIRSELGSSHYTGAIWLKNCSLVQPAELVNGLVATLPENVSVFADTVVSDVSGSSPYQVTANNYQIIADSVVLCVNVSLPEFGYAKYRQLPVYTYAGLTRPLGVHEAAALGGAPEWGLTPVERLAATSRKVDGNRYMLRGGFSYRTELPVTRVRTLLADLLNARYPDMPADLLDHVWGGAVSMTRNGHPFFRQLGNKLYAVSGCNASGILKMSMLGKLLADYVADVPSELLSLTRKLGKPTFIPPDPIRGLAFNVSLHKLQKQMNNTLRA